MPRLPTLTAALLTLASGAAAAPITLQWQPANEANTWDTTALHWTNGSNQVAWDNNVDASAKFLNSSGVINVTAPVKVRHFSFKVPADTLLDFVGDGSIELRGGSGRLGRDSEFFTEDESTVVRITTKLTHALNDGGLLKLGRGRLVLSGAANDYKGVTTIRSGVLEFVNNQPSQPEERASFTPFGTSRIELRPDFATPVALYGSNARISNPIDVLNPALSEIGTDTGDIPVFEGPIRLFGPGMTPFRAGKNPPLLPDDLKQNVAVNGEVSGLGGIRVIGRGTLFLGRDGGNTYTGGTVIDSGILVPGNTTGSATGTGAVVVNRGGTLGGIFPGLGGVQGTSNGIITGPVTLVGGTIDLSDGGALGEHSELKIGQLTMDAQPDPAGPRLPTLKVAANEDGHSKLDVNGRIWLMGSLVVDPILPLFGDVPQEDKVLYIITGKPNTPVQGRFLGLDHRAIFTVNYEHSDGAVTPVKFQISYHADRANNTFDAGANGYGVALRVLPSPSTAAVLVIAGVTAARRRRSAEVTAISAATLGSCRRQRPSHPRACSPSAEATPRRMSPS